MSQGFVSSTNIPLPLAVQSGGTGVTTSTGTGSVVLSNSPTLVTPALGTPSALVLTNSTGDQLGVTDGSNAAAGHVGEEISAVIGSSSPTALSNNTITNILSIVLTPGDWDVSWKLGFIPAGAFNYTILIGEANLANNVISGTFGSGWAGSAQIPPTGNTITFSGSPFRSSVTVNTTYFLNLRAVFSAGSVSGFGLLRARRMR